MQQVLHMAAEDTHRPVPLQAFVEDAVSICAIVLGKLNASPSPSSTDVVYIRSSRQNQLFHSLAEKTMK